MCCYIINYKCHTPSIMFNRYKGIQYFNTFYNTHILQYYYTTEMECTIYNVYTLFMLLLAVWTKF